MKRISIAFYLFCAWPLSGLAASRISRPQFERAGWVNLNGEWTCSFDFGGSGMEREFYKSKGFDKKITVPFCPESKLSGIGYMDFINHFWYQRPITIPQEWNGKNILLNFGAVTINRKSISTEFWLTAISVGLPRLPWILLLW